MIVIGHCPNFLWRHTTGDVGSMVLQVNSTGHINWKEALITVIRIPQCSMNHHGSGYSNQILDLFSAALLLWLPPTSL